MDHNKLIPLYLQAANRIQQEIRKNNFREGEKLPRLNQLSRMMKLNTSALEKAILHLIEEDILQKRSSLEYVVVRGARDKILNQEKVEFFQKRLEPILKDAQTLGISQEEIIQYLNAKGGTA